MSVVRQCWGRKCSCFVLKAIENSLMYFQHEFLLELSWQPDVAPGDMEIFMMAYFPGLWSLMHLFDIGLWSMNKWDQTPSWPWALPRGRDGAGGASQSLLNLCTQTQGNASFLQSGCQFKSRHYLDRLGECVWKKLPAHSGFKDSAREIS